MPSTSPIPECWQSPPSQEPPPWFLLQVQRYCPGGEGKYAAQLLWQRGIRDPEQLKGFVDPNCYQPTPPAAFGTEMVGAVQRFFDACDRHETVAIWGDFDADGITATAVLWEGLGQFIPPSRLVYEIPNRLTASHGLAAEGLERLAAQGVRLMITCDTGSTNLPELAIARDLALDVIITDHHTLPPERPPVTAILNPRYFDAHHPLAQLSGVAVAYKFVEALYQERPEIPTQPLAYLNDLVAIGLIADLVELRGDCRYLAQVGLARLQEQADHPQPHRPGVAQLLKLCRRAGDRPTDISFGLGPRINAVSRIQGDARFCVELLTSRDPERCRHLAEATELANARRQSLQKQVLIEAEAKLRNLDLSTTLALVLAEPGWPVGILGIVAGQLAQTHQRPVFLLSQDLGEPDPDHSLQVRGSARSVAGVDLYDLLQGLEPLLTRFGGHPMAAGLALPVENLPLFTDAVNQRLRQLGSWTPTRAIAPDLLVTVADLWVDEGKALFRELKLLEPCGMGNPVPKLLLQNIEFKQVWHRNIKDCKGGTVGYIKTTFEVWDDTATLGFPGLWWGHYKDELPLGLCDGIVELDFNTYERRYELRLLAVRPAQGILAPAPQPAVPLLDWRRECPPTSPPHVLPLTTCPRSWQEWQAWIQQAQTQEQSLAIAYGSPPFPSPEALWQTCLGLAKYLDRTQGTATRQQLQDRLGIGLPSLEKGLAALRALGCTLVQDPSGDSLQIRCPHPSHVPENAADAVAKFLQAVEEEQFRQRYFHAVPLATLQTVIQPSTDPPRGMP